MHEYDIAFKLTLQQVDVAIRELTGTAVVRWLSLELPDIRNTRVDLLGGDAPLNMEAKARAWAIIYRDFNQGRQRKGDGPARFGAHRWTGTGRTGIRPAAAHASGWVAQAAGAGNRRGSEKDADSK